MSTENPFAAPERLRAVEPKSPVVEKPTVAAPSGTIAEIKRWVGFDEEKASLALAAEEASDSPRITLVSYLRDISSK